MDTPLSPSPTLFKPTTPHPPPPPPPPPPPLSPSLSRDLSFSYSLSSQASPLASLSPAPLHVHLRILPLPGAADMYRAPLVRVVSDLSHNNYAKANHHHQTTTSHNSSSDDRDMDSSFFSGFSCARGGVSRDGMAAGKAEEKMRRWKRGLEVGQWVKKYTTSLVEQLRATFSWHGERERPGQRRRPHSFSGNDPGTTRERERWRQRREHLSSAPASLRASPANSGHLSVGGSVKVSTSSEESTMEELQSAIQDAIAHCKNSIAVAR